MHNKKCQRLFKDLTKPMSKIAKKSFKEGIEYGTPICLTKNKFYVLGDVIKGEESRVRVLARCPTKTERVGTFHTHPKDKSEFSIYDKLILLSMPLRTSNIDCVIGEKDKKTKCVVIPEKMKDEKWYQKSSNLAYRWITGTYSLPRIKDRFMELSKPLDKLVCEKP